MDEKGTTPLECASIYSYPQNFYIVFIASISYQKWRTGNYPFTGEYSNRLLKTYTFEKCCLGRRINLNADKESYSFSEPFL